MWPGFSENARILKWMISRLKDQSGGETHFFGTSPSYADIDWTGLSFDQTQFDQVSSIDVAAWREEFALHDELFQSLSDKMPAALLKIRETMQTRLDEMSEDA